jgi:phosphate starvation-inducible PhoH-like protein
VEGIGSIHLTSEDVVRHRLVKQIIKAFDKYEARRQALGRKKKGKKEEE